MNNKKETKKIEYKLAAETLFIMRKTYMRIMRKRNSIDHSKLENNIVALDR